MDRSAKMRAIRSKDMMPELAVWGLVHRDGWPIQAWFWLEWGAAES